MLTPEQTTEMLTLQAHLAYSAARSDIECHCMPVGDTVRDGWHDPSACSDGGQFVDPAIRYLELRGLLERHPAQPWVRVRNEA